MTVCARILRDTSHRVRVALGTGVLHFPVFSPLTKLCSIRALGFSRSAMEAASLPLNNVETTPLLRALEILSQGFQFHGTRELHGLLSPPVKFQLHESLSVKFLTASGYTYSKASTKLFSYYLDPTSLTNVWS